MSAKRMTALHRFRSCCFYAVRRVSSDGWAASLTALDALNGRRWRSVCIIAKTIEHRNRLTPSLDAGGTVCGIGASTGFRKSYCPT